MEESVGSIAQLRVQERDAMQGIISAYLDQHLNARIFMTCEAGFEKVDSEGLEDYKVILPLCTRAIMMFSSAKHYIHRQLDRLFSDLEGHVEAAETCGTGLRLTAIHAVAINISKVRIVT